MQRQSSIVIGFRLTKPYAKRLTAIARLEGRSLSALIRRAVERHIELQPEKAGKP